MLETDSPSQAGNNFLREVHMLYDAEAERLGVSSITVDLFFACYLRHMSRFGYFSFGPVTIDVSLVEEIAERTAPRASDGASKPAISDDMMRWSQVLMEEVRRSGRQRIDELHFLLAYMKFGEGLPGRVFSELGVTPEQVEAYARGQVGAPQELERLYSPEDVADYLNVHVQTVRTWIRSGRLKARRLAGQRALRITQADIHSLLEPIDGSSPDLAEP